MIEKINLWFEKYKYFFKVILVISFTIQLLLIVLIFSVSIPIALVLLLFAFLFNAMFIFTFMKRSMISEILLISFFVLLLAAPLVYAIIYYLVFYVIPTNPEIAVLGSQDSWITFAGSIISGVLVLLALTYTIQYQQKIRDEDKRNELLPLIEINVEFNVGMESNTNSYFDINYPWYLRISNISKNPVRDLCVTELEAWFYNNDTEHCSKKIDIDNNSKKTNLIAMNKYHEIELHLDNLNLPTEFYSKLRLYFVIEYKDLTLRNTHHHSATIDFDCLINEEHFVKSGYEGWDKSSTSNNFIS